MTGGVLTINGRKCSFTSGQTILEAAAESGIDIPTLCYLAGTTPTGRCGICVVEIEGEAELRTACTTPAAGQMAVWTESPRVVAARKETLAGFLASGNHNCAIGADRREPWTAFQLRAQETDETDTLCPAWGDCRLQELAYRYQVRTEPLAPPKDSPPPEMINPLIIRDFSRCISCGRCVAACNEVQVNRAIQLSDDGPDARVTTPEDRPLKESNCVFCGECVQACTTGALVEKKARFLWRPWDTTRIRTTCPYCGVGCQQWLHVRDGRIVKVTGVEGGAPNDGRLCVKGRFGYDFIYSRERLKTPLIKKDGGFRQASWEEALDLVAERFGAIIAAHGPDAVAGVSCARSINEDSYQMQKLFRAVFKTNNIDHCART